MPTPSRTAQPIARPGILPDVRLGVVWASYPNAFYRAVDPMRAMARRGHQIAWPEGPGMADVGQLATCDLVHVYRASDKMSRRLFPQLVKDGTAVTYDNDDDFTAIPRESLSYRKLGGEKGQRAFAETVSMARRLSWFTTTTEPLAEKYRRAGVKRVEVIGNFLAPERLQPPRPHDGIVIGWVAAGEHQADADRLNIAEALASIVAKHDAVRVECVGVDLALPERYGHVIHLPFSRLPTHIAGFDIGIAPLADIPMNRSRSDIKVKEYAASGVPWLASPVGPYVGLGDPQGGRLVPDDGWFEALDQLVTSHRERDDLARKATAWARSQSIETAADRWEKLFVKALAGNPRRRRGPQPRVGPSSTLRIRKSPPN